MKESNINFYDFERKFNTYFNGERANNFSHKGKRALFEYLEEYEDSTGEEIELDIIALCVEYTEYKDVEDFINRYMPKEIDNFETWKENEEPEGTDEEIKEAYEEYLNESLEEYLNDNTVLIKFGDDLDEGFIVQDF